MKILYAEDDGALRQILKHQLEKWGYTVLAVSDGAEAWEVLQRNDCPQLVLLDWEMPKYQGTELCRMVRELEGKDSLYILLLTARNVREDVIQGLDAGADDYLKKPFDKGELKARLNVGCRTISLRNQLEEKNQRMQKSLEAAATVQKSFLPASSPEVEGYEFGWKYLPSEYLGGDMLHLSVEGDYIICCVLDASGHGVPAALLSVTVGNHIRQTGMVAHGSDVLHEPAEIMNRLSKYFKGLFQRTGQYFTMLYGALNIKTGEFRFAQAGHPFPIARCNGKFLEAVVKPNVAMGIIKTTYDEHSFTLAAGDELLLYTDGVTETVRPSDSKYFGVSGVIDALESAGAEGDDLETLLKCSLRWGECTAFEDDATLLRIKRL